MPALTRAEAEARARLLTVHRYTVHLDLTGGREEFHSRTEIGFTAREAADTFVELKPATLHRAVLDGQPLDPITLTDGRLPLTLAPGEHTLLVEADMRYSRTGEGLHRFTDPADGETYVHSQAFLDSEPTPYERGYRTRTVAHEMAHMWFGDLVTMRWWDDLWLNESFADLMAYEVTGDWPEFAVHRKTWGYDADQRPSTHPVAPSSVPDTAAALLNFDGISYVKGASALRQLSAWLCESTFRTGVDTHPARHRFGNAWDPGP